MGTRTGSRARTRHPSRLHGAELMAVAFVLLILTLCTAGALAVGWYETRGGDL